MNNRIKNSIKNKKYIFLFTVVLLFVGVLAFSLLRGRANVVLNEEDQSSDRIFSAYEEFSGAIVKLYVDKDKSIFYDSENKEIYSTTSSVDYFRILDSKTISYVSSSLNTSTNRFISDVVYVDLETKKETVLISGEQLFLEVSNGSLYIIDGVKGTVVYGTVDDLKEYSLNTPISKVSSSMGKIFAINHTVINNVVRSTIYCVTDTTIDKIICPGKVQSVNVDYNNDNIIYYSSLNLNNSINSSDSSEVVVFKKYLVDLSASESQPEAIYNLNSNIISIKDKYISVDKDTHSIYLLTDNFSKLKQLDYISKSGLSSFIKVSTDGENIYFINKSGLLKKI